MAAGCCRSTTPGLSPPRADRCDLLPAAAFSPNLRSAAASGSRVNGSAPVVGARLARRFKSLADRADIGDALAGDVEGRAMGQRPRLCTETTPNEGAWVTARESLLVDQMRSSRSHYNALDRFEFSTAPFQRLRLAYHSHYSL